MIAFTVHGHPAPQGSKVVYPNGGMKESSPRLQDWRSAVKAAAAEQRALTGWLTVPLHAEITFRLPMPKSAPKYDRAAGVRYRVAMPDLDKLLRSTFDGLTHGGLIVDDALIVSVAARKVDVTDWTGASITLEEVVPL